VGLRAKSEDIGLLAIRKRHGIVEDTAAQGHG
jgi:hypothetical protein